MNVYRRAGFPDVKVRSAVVPEPGPVRSPRSFASSIEEGPRVVLGTLAITGNATLSEAQLREGMRSAPGQPLYQPQLAQDRDGMLLKYLNLGYRNADIDVHVDFSPDRSRADVRFEVREGQQIFVDHVLVVGNERTKAETVRREIVLQPGDPLGFDSVAETQRRISALGLFRRVRITEIDHGATGSRDVLVTVEEAPATTLGYGGGVEVTRRLVRTSATAVPDEQFQFAPRGFVEIGRRNLFGRNRSVNLFTRVSLRARGDSVITEDGVQPATEFNEYRVLGHVPPAAHLRHHRLRGERASSSRAPARASTSTAAALVPSSPGGSARGGASARRYALERTKVFNETVSAEDELLIDRLFPQVRLSSVSSSLIRDTRDDPLGTIARNAGRDRQRGGRTRHRFGGGVREELRAGVRLSAAAGPSRHNPGHGRPTRPRRGLLA